MSDIKTATTLKRNAQSTLKNSSDQNHVSCREQNACVAVMTTITLEWHHMNQDVVLQNVSAVKNTCLYLKRKWKAAQRKYDWVTLQALRSFIWFQINVLDGSHSFIPESSSSHQPCIRSIHCRIPPAVRPVSIRDQVRTVIGWPLKTDVLRLDRSVTSWRSCSSDRFKLFSKFPACENYRANDEGQYDGQCCYTQGNKAEIQGGVLAVILGEALSDDDDSTVAGQRVYPCVSISPMAVIQVCVLQRQQRQLQGESMLQPMTLRIWINVNPVLKFWSSCSLFDNSIFQGKVHDGIIFFSYEPPAQG